MPPLRNPAAYSNGTHASEELPTWEFVSLNSYHGWSPDHSLGGVRCGLGLPGVGDSPIGNTGLAAGSAEAKGSLSVCHSEPATCLWMNEMTAFCHQGL